MDRLTDGKGRIADMTLAELQWLLALGADGIISDCPDRVIKVMRELGSRK